uniref:Protein kinase domain-containing protein n=1 Tax=Panagrolaimus davidi TaxID=227884 RepID=A0A914R723_9BILA
MDKLEMKLGVLQIIDGLSYLHNSAKILHGNLTPTSIFVTSTKLWKIGGLQFAVQGASKHPNLFPCYPWTKKLPPQLQPELDFLAPEYLSSSNQAQVTNAADVFSLGVLICWIYSGGKRLIDANNNLESYNIIINQLDAALSLITDELGQNLSECIAKVVSLDVKNRPAVQFLALIKHFDDPTLTVLRQLDDISQEFVEEHKISFISQTLYSALPMIPEQLWFNRILQRFNENLTEYVELYSAILRPLTYMLNNCESHNIYRLRSWFRRITANTTSKNEELTSLILDNLPVIFRRLNDEEVEDRCYALLLSTLNGSSNKLKQTSLRIIPYSVDYMSLGFVRSKLIPLLLTMEKYFQDNIQRQVELLVAVAHLSDRCDSATLQYLLTVSSVCNSLHPSIVHSKSRLVQRILHTDVSRLTDPLVITHHLLNPLILGLALPEMTSAHFDDVMSSIRILLDIVEQIRYENDDAGLKRNDSGRLYNRRVSMSSSHLPRLLVTAARPSFSGDARKMSFLSADGRLEDRGRRESNQSKSSCESDMSILIGNGSELSDESGIVTAQRGRRKSWLEGYMHSMSLEQNNPGDTARSLDKPRRSTHERRSIRHHHSARTHSHRSSQKDDFIDCKLQQQQPARPNSFTNLGHNLACTLWKWGNQ